MIDLNWFLVSALRKMAEGSGAQVLGGTAEGTGIGWFGEEEAQERAYCSLQLPARKLW